MSYTQAMISALAIQAVKYMGQQLPDLEFVMHPHVHQSLLLETPIHGGNLMEQGHGIWTFLSVPVRIDTSVSNWTISPIPN